MYQIQSVKYLVPLQLYISKLANLRQCIASLDSSKHIAK